METRYNKKHKAGPAFVKELRQIQRSNSSGMTRRFIVSIDKLDYYIIHATSSSSAIRILMQIGVNPKPKTSPPPPPGKKVGMHCHNRIFDPFGCYNIHAGVVPISRDEAMLLIKNQEPNNFLIDSSGSTLR